MTKPNKTEIVFLVDRSGSMKSIAEAMTSGIDEFINKQKLVPGECLVSLIDFDDSYDVRYTALSVHNVPKYTLEPRGMTALYDAIGKSLAATGERLRLTPESERPSQVLFVIVSDGGENSSKEFKGEPGRQQIFDRITHQRSKYQWEFVYLGANQDAYKVGTSLGISGTNSVSYSANEVKTRGMMSSLSANVASYRSEGHSAKEHLFDQATYNAATGDNLGGAQAGDTKLGVGTLQFDPNLLKDAKLSIDAQPAVFPPGTVVTVTQTVATPPDSSKS